MEVDDGARFLSHGRRGSELEPGKQHLLVPLRAPDAALRRRRIHRRRRGRHPRQARRFQLRRLPRRSLPQRRRHPPLLRSQGQFRFLFFVNFHFPGKQTSLDSLPVARVGHVT